MKTVDLHSKILFLIHHFYGYWGRDQVPPKKLFTKSYMECTDVQRKFVSNPKLHGVGAQDKKNC